MRLFLWIIFLFAAAIGLAVAARYNPGNVVLFYPPYRVDLSLNFFLLLAGLSFAVVYVLVKTIDTTRQIPQRVIRYRREKRERAGNEALRDALKGLFEGRFGQAEKSAARAAETPENAGLAGLIGARAAHRMREPDRRDAWLATVEQEKSFDTARLMTLIELLNDEHQPQAALEAVKELTASGTRHIHAQRLALKANQRAENWPEVLRLVRSLDKNNALHPALSRHLRELAYADLLADPSHDAESLRRLWNTIPQEDRVQPYIAVRAADAFNHCGLHAEAAAIVENGLTAEWDERLLRAYRESAAAEGSPALVAQIEHCERWLVQHPADAELALTLGSFCLKHKLWGKAQRHLEQALSSTDVIATVREAHLKLAELHEALGQNDRADAHYRACALAGK